MKRIRIPLFRCWLTISLALFILIASCVPGDPPPSPPVANPCGDVVISNVTVTSQPTDGFVSLIVDFMNKDYNGQLGNVTIQTIVSSKPMSTYQIWLSSRTDLTPDYYLYPGSGAGAFIGVGGSGSVGDIVLRPFEKYSMTFRSRDGVTSQLWPYIIIKFANIDNDCNTDNNYFVYNRFTNSCVGCYY